MTKRTLKASAMELKVDPTDGKCAILILKNRQTNMYIYAAVEDLREMLTTTLHHWDINQQMFT